MVNIEFITEPARPDAIVKEHAHGRFDTKPALDMLGHTPIVLENHGVGATSAPVVATTVNTAAGTSLVNRNTRSPLTGANLNSENKTSNSEVGETSASTKNPHDDSKGGIEISNTTVEAVLTAKNQRPLVNEKAETEWSKMDEAPFSEADQDTKVLHNIPRVHIGTVIMDRNAELISAAQRPCMGKEFAGRGFRTSNLAISKAGQDTKQKCVPIENFENINATANAEIVPKTAELITKSGATNSPKIYELRSTSNRGIGVFATSPIPRGTLIMAESPLLQLDKHPWYLADLQPKFDALPAYFREKVMRLHSAHGQDPSSWPSRVHPGVPLEEHRRINEQHEARVGKEKTLMSIFQTNAICCGDGGAVFEDACRLNHSCVPNAWYSWNERQAKELVHAVKDIKDGEEITISYCDTNVDASLRRWELKHYGFLCDCPACGDASDLESFAAKSAERRQGLNELDDVVETALEFPMQTNFLGPQDRMKRCMEKVQLLRGEGLMTTGLGRAYLDMACLTANLDPEFALKAAKSAHNVLNTCLGPDTAKTERAEKIVKALEEQLQERVLSAAVVGVQFK